MIKHREPVIGRRPLGCQEQSPVAAGRQISGVPRSRRVMGARPAGGSGIPEEKPVMVAAEQHATRGEAGAD